MGHLKGDEASEGIAAQIVWPLALARQNGIQILRGHLLHGVWRARTIHPMRMEGVERLIGIHVTREQFDTVHAEQGRPPPIRLVRQETSGDTLAARFDDSLRQGSDRRCCNESSQRDVHVEGGSYAGQ